MTEHFLKLEYRYWDAVNSGEKNFEVRRDDRGFQKGDVVTLCKFGKDPRVISRHKIGFMDDCDNVISGLHTSNRVAKIQRKISYVLTGGQFGIEPGYVILGLREHNTPKEKPNISGEKEHKT